MVDKITVTDKDAEVEKLTGIRQGRGNNSKNMDISLKQEYAEGLFGNLQAFGGASVPGKEKNDMMASIPFLWNTSGMLSAYNKHDQLTLLARGQNVSAGGGLESMLGRGGITTGGQAGANYTTDRIKKVDTGVSVSYNGTSREDARRSFSQDFPLSGDTVESGSTSSSLSGNHRLNASVNFRSSGIKGISFSFSPQFTFSDARSDSQSASSSQVNGTESNSSSSLNTSHSRTLGTSGTLMVASKLFSKKGRSLRVIGNYALQGQQGTSRDYSLTSYAASHASSERDLHYENDGGNGNGVLNLFYVEPLADSWLFQSGVRGQVTRSRQDRAAFNADGSANDFYSNLSVNNSASGSGDFLLQYAKEDRSTVVQAGFSLSADHLYTYSRTQGRVTEIGEGEWLWNVAPVLRLTTPWFSLDYMGQSSQPSHSRMIAVPDITDPLRISTGNRYLRPGFDHMVALRRGPGRPDPQNPRRGSVQGAVQLHIRQNPVVSAVWYDADRIRYSICAVDFDPATRRFGEPRMVFDAAADSLSAVTPRPSPDGRYLLSGVGGYGSFHVWHEDGDLYLTDLATGRTRPLDELNSPRAESFKSWSSNSRWIVFTSRRDDGSYSRLYLSHFGADGRAGKPFLMPQRDPEQNRRLFKSYNVPEFTVDEVRWSTKKLEDILLSDPVQAKLVPQR